MRVFSSMILALIFAAGTLRAAEVKIVTQRPDGQSGRTTLAKRTTEDRVYQLVPHLAASQTWKSQLLIRNDSGSVIDLDLDFFGQSGIDFLNRVEMDMITSDNEAITAGALNVILNPFEIFTLEFREIYDTVDQVFLINFQVFVSSSVADGQYSLEPQFYWFPNAPTQKVAAVGVAVQQPGDKFFMNIDRRLDLDTNYQRIRGIAITNFETVQNDCSIAVFDQYGSVDPVIEVDITLGDSEKLVDRVDNIIPNLDNLLPDGLGLFDCRCTGLVGALGLVFEPPIQTVGSVPIDFYEIEGNKRIVRPR